MSGRMSEDVRGEMSREEMSGYHLYSVSSRKTQRRFRLNDRKPETRNATRNGFVRSCNRGRVRIVEKIGAGCGGGIRLS